jgi:peptide/nickel transport system permease protein
MSTATMVVPRSRLERFRTLWRSTHPTARRIIIAGAAITGLFLILAVAAPLVAPYGEAEFQGIPQLSRPTAKHIFGTTNLRYDVFSRVVFGTRLAFEVVILSTAFAMLIGVPLGLIAGYSGRRLDRVLVLVMDALFAFPSLLLAIVAAFALRRLVGQGVPAAALSISVIYIPQYFRVVRNHTLSVREEAFVEAAKAMGARRGTIVGRYILFNVIQSVPVIFTVNAADAILTLAGLGFLGYGVKIPAAEWGYDISRAISDAANGLWWTSFFPGVAILGLVTGLTLLGEGTNDIVNPLLRRRGVALGAPSAGIVAGPTAAALELAAPGAEAVSSAVKRVEDLEESVAPSVPKEAAPVAEKIRTTAPLLIRNLRVTYRSTRGPVVAVDGVDLELHPGESLGLVGESGCGKSTLGRAVVGILPEEASVTGDALVDGEAISALPAAEQRRARGERVALVFQEPMTRLDPLQTIEDHFAETITAHRPETSREQLRRLTNEALTAIRIPPTRASQYPHEFSGGMRQRIMIALAIALRPKLVIADEPTTALDVLVEAQILEILRDLVSVEGISVLLITHNLGIVAETCDRVAVMYAGKIVEVGPVHEVFSSPKHPYTQGLLSSVIHLGSTKLSSIAGGPPDLLNPPPACRFHPRCPYAMEVCRTIEPPPVSAGQSRVACWLHGPEDQIPAGGKEPIENLARAKSA